MTDKLQPFEVGRISRDPLDDVRIGDWYWVKDEKSENEPEHEHLFCVRHIGSNYVDFEATSQHGTYNDKIHFNEFFARCRPEPNWKEHLKNRMDDIQAQIQAKTRELVEHGQKLFLLEQPRKEGAPSEPSLLPVKVADEPKRYKKELVKLKDDTLPAISKEIDELAKDYAVAAKDMALPDLLKLRSIKKKLDVVEDKIFTIELYCGLQEDVCQIAEGDPAAITEKIAIRQAMLFMDEETLFDYEEGGMDFEKIEEFDKWVSKPENLSRILPELRGIVAFRVRREKKDYGEARNIGEAWAHIAWAEANEQTYLLIRNGGNVYRIASGIDFSPRLIPMRNEIGEEQFKKIDERYVYEDGEQFPFGKQKQVRTETLITPEHIDFDKSVGAVDALLKQYNRIVILIQGLLDRSKVFHPHPPINLMKVGELDSWIRLIRDEEDGLPCNRVTFDEYRNQLNKTLKVGKWVYIRYPKMYQNSKYDHSWYYYDNELKKEVRLPYRGWSANGMPFICKIDAMKRDKSAVRVSWAWGQRSTGVKYWVESKERKGWGHYEHSYETDRMCHEWVPTKFVLNMSDYNLGDYKMFLCDRALRGKYLEWAPFLLNAEDWQRRRAKGISADDDGKAQVKRR